MIFVEFHHVLQGANVVNIGCAKIVGVGILDFISCHVTSQNLVICQINPDNLLIALIIVSFPSLSRAESGGSVTGYATWTSLCLLIFATASSIAFVYKSSSKRQSKFDGKGDYSQSEDSPLRLA